MIWHTSQIICVGSQRYTMFSGSDGTIKVWRQLWSRLFLGAATVISCFHCTSLDREVGSHLLSIINVCTTLDALDLASICSLSSYTSFLELSPWRPQRTGFLPRLLHGVVRSCLGTVPQETSHLRNWGAGSILARHPHSVHEPIVMWSPEGFWVYPPNRLLGAIGKVLSTR